MNILFQIILSMSVSGALLIAGVLLINRFLRRKCSRRWQYYIWLLVIARLLLPFGPKASLMGNASGAVHHAVVKSGTFSGLEKQEKETGMAIAPAQEEPAAVDAMGGESAAISSLQGRESDDLMQNGTIPAKRHIGLIWFIIALGILMRKIIMYRSFIKHVMAGAEPVSDFSFEKGLSEAQRRTGVGKTVGLYVNPQVSSPMLIGFWKPCIVLPGTDISGNDFRYTVTHELMHHKRRDILYKWLVQFAVCLHWFNPLVYVMSHEISKACELSCDEAVLEILGYEHAADYGKTLLDAMAAAGGYKEPLTAVSLSANKRILRERLSAIMNDSKKSWKTRMITAGLTAGMVLGAFFVGIYPVDAVEASESPAERFYEAENLPMFEIAFNELDEKAQEAWLNRIYTDGEIAFFSVCAEQINTDSPLMQSFAKKAYEDNQISFFSVLADGMNEEQLEEWLDQALVDEKWNFQSMIYDELGWDEKSDDLEKDLDEKLTEEYRTAGIVQKGKNYYYEEQLVHIFLDIHKPDERFYTLNINPAGTVNVKILREEDGKIIGAAYMTEAEVTKLFGDMNEEDASEGEAEKKKADNESEEAFPRTMIVKDRVCKIRDGAGVEFKVVGLVAEGEELTVLGGEEGSNGQLWYRLDKESLEEKPDSSVESCYIRADLLREDD